MRKKKIIRWLLITLAVILGVLVFLSITGTVAHAAGLVDNTVSDANAYSKYPLENYQLDFYVDSSWDWLPWNWLDGIGKSIQYGLYAVTNFVWTVSLYISNATGYVVQEAYKLDFISDTASSIGKNIQTLAGITSSGFSTQGFYVGFLLILILVMGIYVAYTGLLKRETTKAIHAVNQLSCGVPVIRFIHCLRPKLYQQNQRFFRRYKQLGVIARYKNRAARFQQQGKRQCGFDKG